MAAKFSGGYAALRLYESDLHTLSEDKMHGTFLLNASGPLGSVKGLDFDKIVKEEIGKPGMRSADAVIRYTGDNGDERLIFAEFKNGNLYWEHYAARCHTCGAFFEVTCPLCGTTQGHYTKTINELMRSQLRQKAFDSALAWRYLTGCPEDFIRQQCAFVVVFDGRKNAGLLGTIRGHENLAGIEHRFFCLDNYEGTVFSEVHTYTKARFGSFLRRVGAVSPTII